MIRALLGKLAYRSASKSIAKAVATRAPRLDLSDRGLTSLPPEIGRLTALQWLKLYGNQLTSVPPEIGRLTVLKYLDLYGNQLTSLPQEIGPLAELQWLSLHGNQLTSLPPEIGRLTALQTLILGSNHLTSLPPEIGRLTELQTLSLGFNQLTSLPLEIGRLTALQTLDLRRNQLTSVPPEIGRLAALEYLDLRGNQLTSLPPEIGQLTALRFLFLDGNPLTNPPPEVVSQGVYAIRAYLRELDRGAVRVYEAKVVLAGEPDVGKTTLRERLVTGRFATPESTRGLELGRAVIDHPAVKGARMTLNFWDFGGQEDYRPAQQVFFSKAALYLLIWHSRHNMEQARLENWLRLVSNRTGRNARVIVVATHADQFTPTANVTRLTEAFPGLIAGYLSVDSKSGTGIDTLRQMISTEVRGLEEFGAERPTAWIEARDAILSGAAARGRRQMPFDEFNAAAVEKGVAPEAVEVFATMLSNQGRIVYHGDDLALAGTVILDPEWLMKAIAYLLQDEATRKNGGVLVRGRLAAIWRDHGRPKEENPYRYDAHQWGFLLALMARHGIMYKLSEREWMVPALAPAEPPANLPWDGRSSDNHGEPLRLECRLDEPLPGLMALLTARTASYHVDFRRYSWRGGVFLRDPFRDNANEARIEEVIRDTAVAIAVRGATKWALMDRLAGDLEQLIHEKWPAKRKPYHLYIPCPTSECPGRFDRHALLTDLKEGEKTAKCSDALNRHGHSIHRLLFGLLPGGFGQEASLEREGIREIIQRVDQSAGSLAEIQSYMAMWARHSSKDEPPRFYSLKPVETSRWDPRQLLGQRIEITVWCEELKAPVEGATSIITLDPAWVSHLREYGPTVHKLVSVAAFMSATVKGGLGIWKGDLGALRKATGEIVAAAAHLNDGTASRGAKDAWASEDRSGRLVGREFGTPVKPEVAAELRKAAENGRMRQIRIKNVWAWVCPAVADRNDPSLEKERE